MKDEILALLVTLAISPGSQAGRFDDRTQIKDLRDGEMECLDKVRVNRESCLMQIGQRLGQDSTFSRERNTF